MSFTDALIDDYLRRYAASLEGFDAKAAAGLWATPGMIVDDRFSGVIDSHSAVIDGLERSYPLYQQLGLSSVRYELLRKEELSDHARARPLALPRCGWGTADRQHQLLRAAPRR